MPYTLNGVGTHYYGKKDIHVEQGVCEHCNKVVNLQSYETRLWFVVVFIPIIPLGRKQIFDYCPRCTRHRAMGANQWQTARQEATRESLDAFRNNPDDPEAAITMHATLVQTFQKTEAEETARMMALRFHDNADVLMYLGAWHEHVGNETQANDCFENAWQADPNRDDTRRAMGLTEMERGNIDGGLDLLAPLMNDPEKADLGLKLAVAGQLDGAGRSTEALDLFTTIAQEHPDIARKDNEFRKTVGRLEKQLGRKPSILPFRLPKSLAVAAIVAIILAAMVYFVLN